MPTSTDFFDIADWRALAGRLAWAGYTVTPAHLARIDRSVAQGQRCPHCGQGLSYAGRQRPGTYRAFAVCAPCNQAAEF